MDMRRIKNEEESTDRLQYLNELMVRAKIVCTIPVDTTKQRIEELIQIAKNRIPCSPKQQILADKLVARLSAFYPFKQKSGSEVTFLNTKTITVIHIQKIIFAAREIHKHLLMGTSNLEDSHETRNLFQTLGDFYDIPWIEEYRVYGDNPSIATQKKRVKQYFPQ